MNSIAAQEFCESVEKKDRRQKRLIRTVQINEDNSPLKSLLECDFHLLFESSTMKPYKYMVREPIVGKIERISKILFKEDKILIIRSVWRSVAQKSMHATGGAVDALIYDLCTDSVLDFGTNDGLNISLGRRCYTDHPGVSPGARKNRKLLVGLFEQEDFVPDRKEFWHFDHGNAVWAIEKKKEYAIYGIIGA